MSLRFSRIQSSAHPQEAVLTQEVENVEFELSVLERFLSAAPRLREESRYLIPPPEEFVAPTPKEPNRAQLKRLQRQSDYYATKLVTLLSIFLLASIWFVDRLLTVMR